MTHFYEIMIFTYKGKNYKLYLNSCNKKFFTSINSLGIEEYITIEEYIELLLISFNQYGLRNIEDDTFKEKKINRKKLAIIPKVIVAGTLTILTSMILSAGVINYKESKKYDEYVKKHPYTPVEQVINTSTTTDFKSKDYRKNIIDEKENEGVVVDTYIDNRALSKRLYIYDMDYIDLAFDFDKKSLDDFIKIINSNSNIGAKFKPLLIEYCKRVFQKYPNIELRQFYKNLETLEVIECDKDTMLKVTLDLYAVGSYIPSKNQLYLLKDKKYVEGTWDYQVIFHELSHCLRNCQFIDENGIRVKINFCGLNYWDVPNSEAINSLFAISLLNYDEKDIAYQFQSNIHKMMIDCMDNYSLEDYVNHSLTYYARKLDEYNHDDNYAITIFTLMDAQYQDFYNNSYEADQSQYYPIYDYVSKMYLGKYLNKNMSYDEARDIFDNMINDLLFDVSDKYNVDKNHFYEYFDKYCQNMGISVNKKVK